MRKNVEIEGKCYTQVGERVVNKGGIWIHQQFIEGDHTGSERFGATFGSIGHKHNGETGTETIRESLLPTSLVDSSITYNGKPSASMAYLVEPEYRHMLPEGQSFESPWEKVARETQQQLAVQEAIHMLAGGLSTASEPVQVEILLTAAA